MEFVKGLKYSKEHEWVRVEEDTAYIGITNYAQLALGDIVYVELPELGGKYKANDTLGVVESVKAASDIYTPVSGEVVAVNEELSDAPEKLNEEPYKNWIAAIRLEDFSELDNLMDEEQYGLYCAEEGK